MKVWLPLLLLAARVQAGINIEVKLEDRVGSQLSLQQECPPNQRCCGRNFDVKTFIEILGLLYTCYHL